NPRALFRGYVEGKDGAFHLGTRSLDGLARLLGHSPGKFLFARDNVFGHTAQHSLTFESRQPACSTESLHGSSDRGLGMFAPALKDRPDHAAVEGRADLDRVA